MARRRKKLPEIHSTCAVCAQEITLSDLLTQAEEAHPSMCAGRPILLRVDSDVNGDWVPIVQSADYMTHADKDRLRLEALSVIKEMQSRG